MYRRNSRSPLPTS